MPAIAYTQKVRPVSYVLALFICFIMYFPVAGNAITSAHSWVDGIEDGLVKNVVSGMQAIAIRVLCAYIGIILSWLFIIRRPFSELVYKSSRPILKPYLLSFLFFFVLLFLIQWFVGLVAGVPMIINSYLSSAGVLHVFILSFLFILLITPLHALAEEIMFRNISMYAFSLVNRNWFVLLLSSFLFCLNHGGSNILYWLPVGLLLGITVIKSNSIIYAWALHTAFNLFHNAMYSNITDGTSTLSLFIRSGSKAPDTLYIELIAMCIAVIALFFYNKWTLRFSDIFGRFYRDSLIC